MATEYLNNRVFEGIIEIFHSSKRNKSRYELILEDINDTISRKNKRNYKIEENKDNLKVYSLNYSKICIEYDESQKELANAFYTLSENIVNYAKFKLIDMDDAIQEGVLICFEKINKFDPKKGKAFNYMTTCILNHFRQLYRTARNYNELKKRYHEYLQKMFGNVKNEGKVTKPKAQNK